MGKEVSDHGNKKAHRPGAARFMIGNQQEAEDATQEVFLRLFGIWQNIGTIVTPYFWRGYIRLHLIIAVPCLKRGQGGIF